MPYLYGDTIMLREYRQDDMQAIRAWVNDADSVRYLSSRYWMPQSYADTADFLDHVTHAGPNGAYFVIAQKETQVYIGQIDLMSINWKLRNAEIAMVIGNEGKRGKGIGTQALQLMLDYAFGTLGLERISLEVATANERAIHCYQKAGFTLEGVKRHAFMVDGEYADLAMMAVLSGEWKQMRTAAEA